MTKREKLKLLASHAEGTGARIEDKPIEANPYDKGTDDHLAWNAGWSRADFQLKIKEVEKNDGPEAKAD
jgi:hypothetical protein